MKIRPKTNGAPKIWSPSEIFSWLVATHLRIVMSPTYNTFPSSNPTSHQLFMVQPLHSVRSSSMLTAPPFCHLITKICKSQLSCLFVRNCCQDWMNIWSIIPFSIRSPKPPIMLRGISKMMFEVGGIWLGLPGVRYLARLSGILAPCLV